MRGSKAHQIAIQELEADNLLYMVAPIEMELRAGATDRQLPVLEVFFSSMPTVPMIERLDFKRAGEMFRSVRKKGHGIRSLIDCLVSAIVERHEGLSIAHNDRDYEWIAEVSSVNQQRIRPSA